MTAINKDNDQTVNDFIEDMGIEDCVNFEISLGEY